MFLCISKIDKYKSKSEKYKKAQSKNWAKIIKREYET